MAENQRSTSAYLFDTEFMELNQPYNENAMGIMKILGIPAVPARGRAEAALGL